MALVGGMMVAVSAVATVALVAGSERPPAVQPVVETDLFPDASGDVADDSAIWRNPDRPERSLVLADNKSRTGGVAVHDLDGKIVHYEKTGRIGNIDLRDGVRVGDRTLTLVGANDRSHDTLRFWSLDHGTGTLTSLEDGDLPSLADNYGFCLGRSTDGRKLYAVVTSETQGTFAQYELNADSGRIRVTPVRTVTIGSQSEGCAVDDRTGALYLSEEDVALWRYDLDPATGSRRKAVDTVGTGGHLVADVEGVSLTRGPRGDGVLVVSNQGDSTYAVYDLDGANAYRGTFQVGGTEGGHVDGVSVTDGVAVAMGTFGPRFPAGLLVVHDAENVGADGQDARASNHKFVRLDPVLAQAPRRHARPAR
jgi:3-phytase